jgi:lipopolysaccharide transport system ATP-binding protein
MWLQIEGEVKQTDPGLNLGYAIYTEDGVFLYGSYHQDAAEAHWPALKKGANVLRTRLPCRLLNEGVYRIEFISRRHIREWLCAPGKNIPQISLTIQGGLSDSPSWMTKRRGILAPVYNWRAV